MIWAFQRSFSADHDELLKARCQNRSVRPLLSGGERDYEAGLALRAAREGCAVVLVRFTVADRVPVPWPAPARFQPSAAALCVAHGIRASRLPRSSSAALTRAVDYERDRTEETPLYGIVETY